MKSKYNPLNKVLDGYVNGGSVSFEIAKDCDKLLEEFVDEKLQNEFESIIAPKIIEAANKGENIVEIDAKKTDSCQMYYMLQAIDPYSVSFSEDDYNTLSVVTHRVAHKMHKLCNLKYVSVILAQIFYEYLDGYSIEEKKTISENLINFLFDTLTYPTYPASFDKKFALDQFEQHNECCRYECYCCSSKNECIKDDDYDPVSIDNPLIQNIIQVLNKEKNND